MESFAYQISISRSDPSRGQIEKLAGITTLFVESASFDDDGDRLQDFGDDEV